MGQSWIYGSMEAVKGWSVAWITLSGLGILFLLGGSARRGGGATAFGIFGLLATLPAEILNAMLVFGSITTPDGMKSATDAAPLLSALQFAGWALVVIALLRAGAPVTQPVAPAVPTRRADQR